MTETVIGLLRHGQTDWNIDFRLQGTTDIPLNETGLNQAHEVGSVIRATDWDAIVTSPLIRAMVTGGIVSERTGLPLLDSEDLLLERAFGIGEGLTYEEWREKFRDLTEIPGGESLADLTDRCRRLLDHLAEKYSGRRILTVSHGALIRRVLEIVSNFEVPREGERFKNASMSVITHTAEQGWRVRMYNPNTYTGEVF